MEKPHVSKKEKGKKKRKEKTAFFPSHSMKKNVFILSPLRLFFPPSHAERLSSPDQKLVANFGREKKTNWSFNFSTRPEKKPDLKKR